MLLNLKLLPEDAASITLNRPHEMEVFNATHPLPPLTGSEASSAAFDKLPRTER